MLLVYELPFVVLVDVVVEVVTLLVWLLVGVGVVYVVGLLFSKY